MAGTPFSFRSLLFFCRILQRKLRNLSFVHRKQGCNSSSNVFQLKFQRNPSMNLLRSSDYLLSTKTLIFDVEGALMKSSCLFPYFMLVAFEAGGLIRALILLLLYPFVWLVSEEMGLNIMVIVSFCGIKKESFRVGRAVLPKFFLEDVGIESYEMLRRYGTKVGVSDLPNVMVDGFLREYLKVDFVVGRELKVFCGYYVGLMEDKRKDDLVLKEIFAEKKMGSAADIVGFGSFYRSLNHHYFSHCKEIYLVSEADKKNWQVLPREKYPKPLIFHDGRLAFRPTPLATLAMFIWIPFGLLLFLFRLFIGLALPYNITIPLLAFTGMRLMQSDHNSINSSSTPITTKEKQKGILYVCNHRTLLDPIYLCGAVRKPLTAVTYSLSRVCEIIAPLRTVRLTRNREKDAEMMEKMLKQGDLVVCPEGTTCREPYLLRFSPLFAEVSDEIVPVAIDVSVSMFYGTTASGYKFMDPIFFTMNPRLSYSIKLLEKMSSTCSNIVGEKSRFEVANHVQREVGKALGFECTNLTRKEKYMILAGNEGIVNDISNFPSSQMREREREREREKRIKWPQEKKTNTMYVM